MRLICYDPVTGKCINRNILECKDFLEVLSLRTFPSINRNILECKDLIVVACVLLIQVLIETYWNVKFFCNSP